MNDPAFEVQGHRGARGLRPENTLSGFELAMDLGVMTIETDVRLTRDGVPVLFHDARIAGRLVRGLDLGELRDYRVDHNPDAQCFPAQVAAVGALSRLFAEQCGFDPWTIPTLADLFALAAAYTGALGERAGKTHAQRQCAGRLIFDVELKRVPFDPHDIGDGFDGSAPAALERSVLAEVEHAGVVDRVRVRSFDHRSVWCIGQLQPRLRTAILNGEGAQRQPGALLAAADAEMYCPYYEFVDAAIVRQVHDAGKRIVPWTVNEPQAWARLIEWHVDGITTDYPDRLLAWMNQRG